MHILDNANPILISKIHDTSARLSKQTNDCCSKKSNNIGLAIVWG